MDPSCALYSLSPPLQTKGRKLLVQGMDAIRLCREGEYEKVVSEEVELSLASAVRRDRQYLCAFLQRTGLVRAPLSSLDDHALTRLLQDALRGGELVAVRERGAGAAAEESSLRAQRKLVAAIEKASRRPLSHQGRSYRLIADVDLAAMPNRDNYEVVSRKDALSVFEGIARLAGPDLARLLTEAGERLTQDWRPPFSPDGLILLRALIQQRKMEPAPDERGWRPGIPKKSIFNSSGSPEPEQPQVDTARQAATLVAAARDGVPFCEECMRARGATGPQPTEQ
jgi:hypothetical protein